MANARCSTDKPIPHRLCSTVTVNSASHASTMVLPSISARRKPRKTRRTPTSLSVIRPIMSMLRICSSPECTIPVMRTPTTTGWKVLRAGYPKVMMNPTTVVGNRYSYTCPHSCRTSSSSSPTSVTSCTGDISCGTSPADRMIYRDMESWNTVTGLQVFPSLTMPDWEIRTSYQMS